MPKASTKKQGKKTKTLSPEERARRAAQRRHKSEIRNIFEAAGFDRAEEACDKEFTFQGTTSDFDDIFILENVIVLTEYTVTKESEISGHLKQKY